MNDEVKAQLARYEIVEWRYDGLNGRIIPWTKEHGGHSDDPSVQAFVLGAEGAVVNRCADGKVYQAGGFAKWLDEQATAYERAHPPTRIPLQRAEVALREDGETRVATCAAYEQAVAADARVLLYFGRSEAEGADRNVRPEAKAAKRFERSTLDSKKAAEQCEGWTLLRFDLSKEAHALFAASLGVTRAPALLLRASGDEAPQTLPSRLTGASLAYRLKRANAAQ